MTDKEEKEEMARQVAYAQSLAESGRGTRRQDAREDFRIAAEVFADYPRWSECDLMSEYVLRGGEAHRWVAAFRAATYGASRDVWAARSRPSGD